MGNETGGPSLEEMGLDKVNKEVPTGLPQTPPEPPKEVVPPGSPEKGAFEEQFKNPKFVEVNGAKVKVVDLKPDHPVSETPIFFGPGWAETISTYKGSLKHIYEQDRRVISLDHPRHGGIPEKQDDIPRVELQRAQNTIATIEASGSEKVDAIAHSQGAIDVAIAASQRPELFRNIVFVDPAGLLGNDSIAKEVARFGSLSARESASALQDIAYPLSHPVIEKIRQLTALIDANIRKRLGKETKVTAQAKEKVREIPNPDTPRLHDINLAKYIAANPARTIAEAQASAKSDIFEALQNLRELGIGISIIHGVDDPLEPMKKTFQVAREKGGMPTEGYYSVRYGHNTLARDTRYVDAALNALKGLEYKSQRRDEI